jgi:hypothetical protein
LKAIYKYSLSSHTAQDIEMPVGARILTVQVQNDVPVIWAVVDPSTKYIDILTFLTLATGELVDDIDGKYIGTYQLSNGLVFHIFQRI